MMFHVEPTPKNIESFHVEQSKTPINCGVCRSQHFSFYSECKDHFLSKEDFSLFKCHKCETLITWPQPLPNKIFSYYESEDYVSHNDTKKGFINRLYQIVKTRSLHNKIKLVSPLLSNHSLLDYGCGTGDFLLSCLNSGINAEGVEPDNGARLVATQKGLNVVTPEAFKNTTARYGVITLWHVLEHTYYPAKTIEDLKSMLTDDGSIIIAVPNYQSHDALHYKDKWAAFDVPRHLFHFSKNSIQELANTTGLKLVKTQAMNFDSFYVSMLSEKYKGGNFVSGVLRGLISNLSALKTGQYSSIIYVLKK
jgi:2-polyprenyl-3-methyl-5-hydroxy-6-metoxy-1,4-benzoquinol methylase